MSTLKLFQIKNKSVAEIEGLAVALERNLQNTFERNLETLLGVQFLASEYATSRGRMDTIGIDENRCPVIIEYKRDRSDNVINQGLFYLDWLMDHRGDFELLVRDECGKSTADKIEWGYPRLICIATDFTKYDIDAVNQMGRNIELIRYRKFGNDLLLLELLTAASAESTSKFKPVTGTTKSGIYKTISEVIDESGDELKNLYSDIDNFLMNLGDDVSKKILKFYFVYRRIKNFVCGELRTKRGAVLLYLKVDPKKIKLEKGFTRDVITVGHYGTGDLEVTIKTYDDFEKAKPLIIMSYEAS